MVALGLAAVGAPRAAPAQLALPTQMRPATEFVRRPGESDWWFHSRTARLDSDPLARPSAPSFAASSRMPVPQPLPPVVDDASSPLAVTTIIEGTAEDWPVGAGGGAAWHWQLLPTGILYKSYLAGTKESRIGTQLFYERDEGWLWDSTLGGRAGILRYGTDDPIAPQGWQTDVEGAAFPRLDPQEAMDLAVADFRIGVPVTYACGPWRAKLAYYHLSSHYGDEFLLRTGTTTRFNYSRDAIVFGLAYYATPDVRLYGEADWGVIHADVTEPWAFQFGVEYSPAAPSTLRGAPFAAVAGHIRQEIDFSGNVVVQAGWQWRGVQGDLVRVGAHYYNGLSPQFELFNQFEEHFGVGAWYDF
jgi:hypothetical protein